MFLFHLPPRVLLIPPDPPRSILLLWRSWAVRRILVHRVIVSLILAPCRARGSATMARRSLVISHVSSHHAHRAVLVFARAKMCGHLPLVRSTKYPSRKPQASFPQFPSHRESAGHLLGGLSPFPGTILSTDRRDSVQMTFGLVRVRTPFNPKKSRWVGLWSM